MPELGPAEAEEGGMLRRLNPKIRLGPAVGGAGEEQLDEARAGSTEGGGKRPAAAAAAVRGPPYGRVVTHLSSGNSSP